MKTLFKITALMLITSLSINAQKHDIYKNSFKVESIKSLVLNIDGAYVKIEASVDDKIHFDYSVEFDNYSKKEIEKQLQDIKTSAQIIDDNLQFETSSVNALSDVVYRIESLFGITFEGDYITSKQPSERQFRQSKQYFYSTNDGSRIHSLKEYLKNLKGLDGKGAKKKIKSKDVKTLKTNFTIRIPSNINLSISALNSYMTFKLNLSTRINVNARNTSLKFMGITNSLNDFDIINGDFRSNEIKGGVYKFNHVSDVKIAELENVTIDSEFTKMKIGEVGENVEIVDFTSEIWIHNFSKDFGDFNMNTDYSEINLFFPEDIKYYIETFGHDTVHYYGELITEIPPSRKNKVSKMMIIGDEINSNKIKINTQHGIIRFGKDFIDVSN